MIQIIPAILSTTEEDFKRDSDRYNASESFKEGWIHIDFMDSKFVPNLSIDPEIVGKYPLNLNMEAHPMAANPKDWVERLSKAGFKRVIFHLESEDDIEETIVAIRSKNMEVGIAVNPETPLEKVEPFIEKIDVLLFMSIRPGFQGNPFIPEVLENVKKAAAFRSRNNNLKIGIDGSVNDTNIKDIINAEVDFVVIGSFLLKGDIDENFQKIQKEIRP